MCPLMRQVVGATRPQGQHAKGLRTKELPVIISDIEQQATSSPLVTAGVDDLVKRMVSAASAHPPSDIEASLGQSEACARGAGDCGTALREVPRVDGRHSASLPPAPPFDSLDPIDENELPAATPAAAATAVLGGMGAAVRDGLSAAPGRQAVRWSTPFVNSSVHSMHAFCNDIEQVPIGSLESGGAPVPEERTTLKQDNDTLIHKMAQRTEQRRAMRGCRLSERANPAAERLLRARQCVEQAGDEAALVAGNVRQTGATEVAERLQAVARLQAAATQLAEDEVEVSEALAEKEALDITCKRLLRWSREEHLQRVRNSAAPGAGTTEQWAEASRREAQEREEAKESMRRAQAKLEGATERLKHSALALALCEDYNRAFQRVSSPRSLPETSNGGDDDGADEDDDMHHRV